MQLVLKTGFFRSMVLSTLCMVVFFVGLSSSAYGDGKFVALGTSSISGVYYPVGKGICELLNKNRDSHLVRCLTYSTGGSIYNIHALRSGELDVAITRADLAYLAANGEGIFKSAGPLPELKIIASLYDNPVGIIVKQDSDIQSVEDILGTRINIGNLGSGKRDFSDLLFKVMDWEKQNFESIGELSTSKMGRAFCAGEVEVLIQAMGIPAKFYDNMINNCDGRFVSIPNAIVDKLIDAAPFFEATVIPGGLYSSNPKDVQTIGSKAVLVTLDKLSSNTVNQIAVALFSEIEKLQDKHAVLDLASVESMVNNGIYIPLHQGIIQYLEQNKIKYRQVDLN